MPFLAQAKIETDNKAIRKLLTASWEKLHHEVFIRLSCLEACQQDFNTLTYLKIRANADVDFYPTAKSKIRTQPYVPSGILHPELYLELKRRDYRILRRKSQKGHTEQSVGPGGKNC